MLVDQPPQKSTKPLFWINCNQFAYTQSVNQSTCHLDTHLWRASGKRKETRKGNKSETRRSKWGIGNLNGNSYTASSMYLDLTFAFFSPSSENSLDRLLLRGSLHCTTPAATIKQLLSVIKTSDRFHSLYIVIESPGRCGNHTMGRFKCLMSNWPFLFFCLLLSADFNQCRHTQLSRSPFFGRLLWQRCPSVYHRTFTCIIAMEDSFTALLFS